jgi:hydrogenase maturation factor
VVVLTQAAAIEGTGILAREKRTALAARLPADLLDRAARFLDDPGISVVRAALAAAATGNVHAMHDPTEGGVAGGLLELAGAAGLGIHVDGDRIPIRPETAAICAQLGLDPLGLIASGALLVAAPPGGAPLVVEALARECIPALVVGELRDRADGAFITRRGRRQPLTLPERDEIARLFERDG